MGFIAYQIANSNNQVILDRGAGSHSCDRYNAALNADGVLTSWTSADEADYPRSGPIAYHVLDGDGEWQYLEDLDKTKGLKSVPCSHPIAWGLHDFGMGQGTNRIIESFNAMVGSVSAVNSNQLPLFMAMNHADYFGGDQSRDATLIIVDGWQEGVVTRIVYNPGTKCYLVDRWEYRMGQSFYSFLRSDAFLLVDSENLLKDEIKLFATPYPELRLPIVMDDIKTLVGDRANDFFTRCGATPLIGEAIELVPGYDVADRFVREGSALVQNVMANHPQYMVYSRDLACWDKETGQPDEKFFRRAYAEGCILRHESLFGYERFWQLFDSDLLDAAAFTTLTANPYDLLSLLALVGCCDDDGKLATLLGHRQFLAQVPVGYQRDWPTMVASLKAYPQRKIVQSNLLAAYESQVDKLNVVMMAQDELLAVIQVKLTEPDKNMDQLAEWIHICYLKQNHASHGVRNNVHCQWQFFEKYLLPLFEESQQDEAFDLFVKAFDRLQHPKHVHDKNIEWSARQGQVLANAKTLVYEGESEGDRAAATKIWYRIWCRENKRDVESAEHVVAFIKAHPRKGEEKLWDHYLDLVTEYVPTDALLKYLQEKREVYDSLSAQERYAYNMAWTVVLAPIAAIWLLLLRFYRSPEYKAAKQFGDIEAQIHSYLDRLGIGGGDHYCQYVMQLHHIYEQIPDHYTHEAKWEEFLKRSSETIGTIQCLRVYHALSKSTFGRAVQRKIHEGGFDIKDVLMLDIGEVDGYNWSVVLGGVSEQVARSDGGMLEQEKTFDADRRLMHGRLANAQRHHDRVTRAADALKAERDRAALEGRRADRRVFQLKLNPVEAERVRLTDQVRNLESAMRQLDRRRKYLKGEHEDRYHRVIQLVAEGRAPSSLADCLWLADFKNDFCLQLVDQSWLDACKEKGLRLLAQLPMTVGDGCPPDQWITVDAFKQMIEAELPDGAAFDPFVNAWGPGDGSDDQLPCRMWMDRWKAHVNTARERLSNGFVKTPSHPRHRMFPSHRVVEPACVIAERFLEGVLGLGGEADTNLLRTCAMVSLALHERSQPRLTAMRAEVTAM